MKNCDAALEGVQKNKLGNPRISKDEAAQEAITGLKRDVQSEKASKKKTTRKRDIKVSTRIEVRGVIMLPDGISDDGELNNDATPDGEVEGNLESWGLAVLGAKGTLWFCEEWNNERLDEWLREILPKPFSFLDNEYGVPADAKKRHWRLLESSRKRLKKHRSVADGYAFKEVKGTAGKAWTEYKIYIVSCQPISPKIYMNEWNTDTVSLSLFDDSDSDLINSPRSTGLTAAGRKRSTSKASLGNPSKGKKKSEDTRSDWFYF
ncbi:hypothetical protein JB92DRAFT_997079 [Gautieria morchelliformis]|nr:hypothetical protein JB92DRAFT_997079 [Gautieria morchelliformis]